LGLRGAYYAYNTWNGWANKDPERNKMREDESGLPPKTWKKE